MAKSPRFSIVVDKEDYEYLKGLAKTFGLSLSNMCRFAIREWVRERKKKTSQNQASNTQ